MESITIKVHKEMLKEIEKCVKPDYGTKSEFIRDAIRLRLREERKKQLIDHFEKNLGFLKHKKTTYAEERRIREKVGREFAKKHGIDLD